MMKRFLIMNVLLAMLGLSGAAQQQWRQWAGMSRYAQDNARVAVTGAKVVFMGNSITEGWVDMRPEFFTANAFTGRGISGQTTSQMLLRFQQDVVALKPKVVVINAGINDIAENAGPYDIDATMGNIVSMVDIAKANKIKVILTTVLPAACIPWNAQVTDAPEKIILLNDRICDLASKRKLQLVDYFIPALDSDGKSFKSSLTYDGLHPNSAGYAVMEPMVLKAIRKHVKK